MEPGRKGAVEEGWRRPGLRMKHALVIQSNAVNASYQPPGPTYSQM